MELAASKTHGSGAQWKKLLRHCLSARVDISEFRDFAKLMISRDPIPARKLIDLVLDSREVTNVEWDPLLPLYVDSLIRLGQLRIPDVLSSLLVHSTVSGKREKAARPSSAGCYQPSTLMMEHGIIQNLMIALTTESAPDTLASAMGTFSAIADWILALLAYGPGGRGRGDDSSNTEDENGQHQHQQAETLMSSPEAITLSESLGILFAALAGAEQGMNALSTIKEQASDLKDRLSRALSGYIPLCAEISIPLRNRLVALQKDFGLHAPGDKTLEDSIMGNAAVSALNFESNVVDTPPVNSRAGLFIYVNALLVGRPLIDNIMLLNYLNNRYGGNRMLLVEGLITATFDVLSNGMYRNESSRQMFLFRTFLVNKLPPFLAEMSASFGDSTPMGVPISRAFGRIDPNTFPSFSESFAMQGNSVLSDVRQEFLFSCALHRLIPESSIEQLLGENPMQTLPVGGQYRKDRLVPQINSNPERAEQLLNEVESMEGNAGAIVNALVEVMHNLCSRKETMTLKSICNVLTRRPQSLDVMLLFKSPAAILQPLCALLDDWKWDEEQGEKQLVYDEFGSILLLILAFKYKYDLTHNDIGINNADSFILRLLERGHASQKLEDMTENQNQNLGAWITALFIAEGISDESMSSCSPQEFYLLVATLFSQSLGACESGKLEFETLKGGFEYLLEPFLLPALVMALAWLGNHIWESESDLAISLKVLHTLIKPSSISGEAQEIHRTVLLVTARTLEGQLKDVRSRHPSRNDIKPILDVLESCRSFRRTGAARRSELDSWKANQAGGGLITTVRNTFSSLVLWSTDPEISMTPPSYTHRQLLAGIRLLGSPRILQGIIDELKLQAETGSADLAIDIAATLVCSPLADSFAQDQAAYHQTDKTDASAEGETGLSRSGVLTLRDTLNLQHESLGKMIETDPYRAELIVRLHRRVEALAAAVPQITASAAVHNIVDNIMGEINLDDVQGGTAAPEQEQQLQQQQQPKEGDIQGHGPGGVPGGENSGTFGEMLGVTVSGPSSFVEPSVAAMADPNQGHGIDTSIPNGNGNGLLNPEDFDDVLQMADIDMGAGDPELIDLDMEGMF